MGIIKYHLIEMTAGLAISLALLAAVDKKMNV